MTNDKPKGLSPRTERWLTAGRREPQAGSGASSERPKYSCFPFGGGSRVCIGEAFAWTEAVLLLATIAQRWRFSAVAAPAPEPRITLRPKGLFMTAVQR